MEAVLTLRTADGEEYLTLPPASPRIASDVSERGRGDEAHSERAREVAVLAVAFVAEVKRVLFLALVGITEQDHLSQEGVHNYVLVVDLLAARGGKAEIRKPTGPVAEGVIAVDPGAPHNLLLPGFVDAQVGGVDEAAQDQGPLHSFSPQGFLMRIICSFSDLKKASRGDTLLMERIWPPQRTSSEKQQQLL
ncbi:hypothetical protein FQN60_000419 [Etheostoma spectabile]|uniref:Uncharacterized protein n=1 Tax=Etheostoma spectabile TaxID=54343 RepID=A0A5J5D0D1_9PERO|nr:hypothetical protein FQN60_000419 [Etheostoma spectabile]